MRKFFKSGGFKATLLGLTFLGVLFLASWNDNHYTRTGKIYKVSPFRYKVIDITDHVWSFDANDIVADGTPIEMIMDTNGTPTYIYDDKIIDYKIISDSED